MLADTTAPAAAQHEPLDPFLLPSETDAHFTLLIVVVLGASVLLYGMLFNSIPAFWDAKTAAQDSCQAAAAQAVQAATIAGDSDRARLAGECQRPWRLLQMGWELGGCALLLLTTFGLYWWLPSRTMRRAGFRPLRSTDAPDMVAAIAELSRELGLRHPPNLVWNPLNRSSSGVAFGHLGRPYLGLYGGTYLRFKRNPELFRAVVLHELAHIRNADIDKAGLAVTVWWAFLAVGLLPAALGMLVSGSVSLTTPFALGWRLVALAALVVFTRAAVLRARELYADQRAAAWDHDNQAISRAVGLLGGTAAPTRCRVPGYVRGALALHPSASERSTYLLDPTRLFRARLWVAVGAGMATTVALQSVGSLLGNAFSYDAGQASEILAAVLFGPLAVGVIGLAIWREELYRAFTGPAAATTSAVVLGLGLGTGMFIGWHLSLASYALDTSNAVLVGGGRLAYEVAFAAIVLGSMTLFCVWLQTCARAWLTGIVLQPGPLRRAFFASVVTATIVLVLWLGFVTFAVQGGLVAQQVLNQSDLRAQLAQFGIPVSDSPELSVLLVIFGFSLLMLTTLPFTPLGLGLLWAVPLAARFLPGPGPVGADLRLRAILIASLVAGVLAAPFSVILLFTLDMASSPFLAAVAGVLLLAAFQTVAGLMVMLRATWLGAVQGLCAAHLSGGLTAAILIAAGTAVGVPVPVEFPLSLWSGGTILASIPILSVAAVVYHPARGRSIDAGMRRNRSHPATDPGGRATGRY